MNDFLEKASSHLTGTNNISQVNTEELEKIARDYPYFSVSHVLLAKKYKAENHSGFLTQVQKAALYFNNPYWLHYQLLDAQPEVTLFDKEEDTETKAVISHPQHVEDMTEVLPAFDAEQKEKQPEVVFSNEEITAASSLAKETLSPNDGRPQPNEEGTKPANEVETEIAPDEMHPEKEEVLEEIAEHNSEVENLETFYGPEVETPIEAEVNEPKNDDVQNTIAPTEEDKIAGEALAEKDLIATVVEESLVQPVSIDDTLDNIETSSSILDVKTLEAVSGETSIDSSSEQPKEKSVVGQPVANEPLIPIEPYYTVDYFASQGIKLVLDKNPQDRLGKQLRSFTDWLKHMKKLGPEDALKSTQDAEVDSTIKNIADTSNTPKEIITEAMADVLVKQGKKEQAIEVYNKLSFLNPDKSTYFANQIQKLKGT
jgi:hypothetical protein